MSAMSLLEKVKKKAKRYFNLYIAPLVMAPSPPRELARGACVGIFIGMTPTEGFQTFLMVVLWNLARPFGAFRFNFKIAYAVSWVSNYLTMVPLYFLFYYTGAVMGRLFWRWRSPVSYGEFVRLFDPLLSSPFPDSLATFLDISGSLLVPLFLGCLPYAAPLSIAAYWVTLRIISAQKERADGLVNLPEAASRSGCLDATPD